MNVGKAILAVFFSCWKYFSTLVYIQELGKGRRAIYRSCRFG